MTDFGEVLDNLEKYHADKMPEAGCIDAGTVKEWLQDAADMENQVGLDKFFLQEVLDMINDRDFIFIPFDKLLDLIGKNIAEHLKKMEK